MNVSVLKIKDGDVSVRLFNASVVTLFLLVAGPCPAQMTTRPVIAIFAAAKGTETTDFLVPFGILSHAA